MKGIFVTSILPLLILTISGPVFGKEKLETATFAGGCFWCVQPVFDYIKGVKKTEAGYANGNGQNPTYEDYAENGYVEAVRVTYDTSQTTYKELLDNFWKQIDPTDPGGQFVDRGPQYRPAIFWNDAEQKKTAEKYKEDMAKSGRYNKPIRVEISKYENFFAAEDYHQEYHNKNALHYQLYRLGSGRDNYIKKIWGDFKPKKK
jgi:methionine-S-sulfoxide reductase